MSQVHAFLVAVTVPDHWDIERSRRELATSIGFGRPEILPLPAYSRTLTDQERPLLEAIARNWGMSVPTGEALERTESDPASGRTSGG